MDGEPRVERVPRSCAPCRRKKARCDRELPCGACQKSKNHCTYDKVSRTPLTRRYLTEVESELAKARALLTEREERRISFPDDSRPRFSPPSQPALNVPADDNYSNGVNDRDNGVGNHQSRVEHRPAPGDRSTKSTSHPNTSPAFSLETPPAGDLDWDERAHGAALNDGMASLIDRNGYMGPASGAALLRMAHDGSGDTNGEERTQQRSAVNTPPILPALYTLAQLEPFIDAFFTTYHISYPIVHEPTFRAQFMEIIPRPNGQSWHVLLYIISAIGCFAASEVSSEADVGLFAAAKQRMNIDMLETGNLTLVQALVLISNYVQKRNRPNSGYNYMGLAKRMAWGLALHKEFPAWKTQPFKLELRRRVWWTLYIFDVGAVITFSRPLDMPATGIEVGIPLNIGDSDLTTSTVHTPVESQCTTLYTHVRCQALFHIATNGIYQRLISDIPPADEMLQLDEEYLQTWHSNLPPFFSEDAPQTSKFRLCHAILRWRWRNFRILMYRPYLMRRYMRHRQDLASTQNEGNPSEDAAVRICLDTAQETIRLTTQFWREERQNILTCWYALYFLFQALLVPVICLRNDSHSRHAPEWRDCILLAMGTMSDMARLNSAATRCHATVTKLCGAYLATDTTQWQSPTNESPQTQMNALYSYMFGPIADAQLFNIDDLQMQESSFMDFMGQLGAT